MFEPFVGPRAPKFIPYAVRVSHRPRHGASLRRRPLAALHSALREVGEFLWGAFSPIRSAV